MAASGDSGDLTPLSLPVLETVVTAQKQNGLRHGDYSGYHGYCNRKLRRLRTKGGVNFSFGVRGRAPRRGHKQEFVRRDLRVEDCDSVRYLSIPLFMAERAWAMAGDLNARAEALQREGEPFGGRLRRRARRRLAKGVEWARGFGRLCAARGDERTQVEAEAYVAFLEGVLFREEGKFLEARKRLGDARRVYEGLSRGVSARLFAERAAEIVPMERHCAYELARQVRAGVISRAEVAASGSAEDAAALEERLSRVAAAEEESGGGEGRVWSGMRGVARVEKDGTAKVWAGEWVGVGGGRVAESLKVVLEREVENEVEGGQGGNVREAERAADRALAATEDAVRAMETWSARAQGVSAAAALKTIKCVRLVRLAMHADSAAAKSEADAIAAVAVHPFALSPDGRAVPSVAAALGDVANHQARTLRTLQELLVSLPDHAEADKKWTQARIELSSLSRALYLSLSALASNDPALSLALSKHAISTSTSTSSTTETALTALPGGSQALTFLQRQATLLALHARLRFLHSSTLHAALQETASSLGGPPVSTPREAPATVLEALDPASLTPIPGALRPEIARAVDSSSKKYGSPLDSSSSSSSKKYGSAVDSSTSSTSTKKSLFDLLPPSDGFSPKGPRPSPLQPSRALVATAISSAKVPSADRVATPSARLAPFPPAPALVPMMAKPIAFDVAHDYLLGWMDHTEDQEHKEEPAKPAPAAQQEPDKEEQGGSLLGFLGW